MVPQETQMKVAAEYKSGKKLREIQEAHGLTRSQVYWVLQQQAVAPTRTKPKSRLDDGDPVTLDKLYKIMEAQDERLQLYERFLRELGASHNAINEHVEGECTTKDVAALRARTAELFDEIAPYLEPREP